MAVTVLTFSNSGIATTFTFNTDPFAGTTALTTPGRQVIMNEISIPNFSIASDTIVFDQAVFNVGPSILFASGPVESLPTSNVNMIVLLSFPTPLAAGGAADLIANQITTDGAGFFIYFNTALNLPRLVYSTNLNDNTSDLKVLARFTENFNGTAGQAAMANFTASNFAINPVPEPSTLTMMSAALGALTFGVLRRKKSSNR
jgi:hypothetical protein